MANVDSNFLIVCDTAFLTQGSSALNLIGIFRGINAPKFPALHNRLTVVANVSGDSGEYDAKIIIKEKSSEILLAELSSNEKLKILNSKNAQYIATFFGLIFNNPGEYAAELYIDGTRKASTIFTLTKV